MNIDPRKNYGTHDGKHEVALYYVGDENDDDYCVHGAVRKKDGDGGWKAKQWSIDGRADLSKVRGMPHRLDLVEIKPTVKGYVNFYRSVFYPTREEADRNAFTQDERIACEYIEVELDPEAHQDNAPILQREIWLSNLKSGDTVWSQFPNGVWKKYTFYKFKSETVVDLTKADGLSRIYDAHIDAIFPEPPE